MIRNSIPGKMWADCEAPKQRLSKPRTNTSSSNLLSLSGQQSQPSSPLTPREPPLSSEEVTVRASENGGRRSRRKSRSKIKEYLHGPSSEEDGVQKPQGTRGGVRGRLSRSGSSLYHLANGKSSSTQLSNQSSRELDNDNSERMRHEITQKAITDSEAARNHVPEPVDEDMHPDDMKSPIRRRSLYTPGLATRTPQDLLRKLPQQAQENEEGRDHRYSTEVPSSSPLDDLAMYASTKSAALLRSENGRSTPTQFNQLGGLGLGTLRITNDTDRPGSASDASLHAHPLPARRDSHEDFEYFTASEGHRSEDDSSVLSMARVAAEHTPKPQRRSDSPLKYESQWGTVASQRLPLESPMDGSPPLARNQLAVEEQSEDYFTRRGGDLQSPDRAPVFAQDYMSELPDSPYGTASYPADLTQSTADMTKERCSMQESSPSNAPIQDGMMPTAEAQSLRRDTWRSHCSDEAEARHADSLTAYDAYRKLHGKVVPRDIKRIERIDFQTGDRSDPEEHYSSSNTTNITSSTFEASLGSERASSGLPRPKSLHRSCTDSGYFSRDDISKPMHGEPKVDPALNGHELYLNHQRPIVEPQYMPPVPLRGNEAYANPPFSSGSEAETIQPALEVVSRPQTMITTYTQPSHHVEPQFPEIMTTASQAPDQPPTVVPNTYSSPSELAPRPKQQSLQKPLPSAPIGTSPVKTKKLHKSRRSSKTIPFGMTPTKQIKAMTDLDIPIIPQSLLSKNAEREQYLPTLNHTVPSIRSRDSEGTRSPSSEIPSVPIRFPSPTNSIDQRSNRIINADISWPTKASKKKAKDLKVEQAAATKAAKRRMSQPGDSATIADFGTVANSLGNSPYDIAKPRENSELGPSTSSVASWRQPHHMSSESSRPKTVVGMGDEEAAELSRLRSEKRYSQDAARLRTQALSSRPNSDSPYPGHDSRPRTMYAGEVPYDLTTRDLRFQRDLGHNINDSHREQSRELINEEPPVPDLPFANQARYLEATAQRDHQANVPVVRRAESSQCPGKLVRPKSMYASTSPITHTSTMQHNPTIQQSAPQQSQPDSPKRPPSLSLKIPVSPGNHAMQGPGRSATVIKRKEVPTRQSTVKGIQGLSRPVPSSDNNAPKSDLESIAPSRSSDLPAAPIMNENRNVTKLKKQRPQSIIPDIWKSDSLRDSGLNNKSPGSHDKSRTEAIGTDTLWAASDQQRSHWRQSASRSTVAEDKRPVNELSRPVAALSLEAALSAHRDRRALPSQVSPMPSATNTPQDLSNSPISPLSMAHGHIQELSSRPTSYLSKSSPRPLSFASATNNIATYIPSSGTYIPTGSPTTSPSPPEVARKSISGFDRASPHIEGYLPRTPTASPPKTVHTRSNTSVLSPKKASPTIDNPTAVIADSYLSNAGAAPAPPAFSVHRKRHSSMNCFSPVPSARSLKPVRPVNSSLETNNPPSGESSSGTSDPSGANTPSPEHHSTAQTTPSSSSSRISLSDPPRQPYSTTTQAFPVLDVPIPQTTPGQLYCFPSSTKDSPTKQPAVSSSNNLSPPTKPSTRSSSYQGPDSPPSRLENVSGRYMGGLEYGYEPGIGIGGSAGTRVPKTGASRKSIAVGELYGLDLSDVPIFVAPEENKAVRDRGRKASG